MFFDSLPLTFRYWWFRVRWKKEIFLVIDEDKFLKIIIKCYHDISIEAHFKFKFYYSVVLKIPLKIFFVCVDLIKITSIDKYRMYNNYIWDSCNVIYLFTFFLLDFISFKNSITTYVLFLFFKKTVTKLCYYIINCHLFNVFLFVELIFSDIV